MKFEGGESVESFAAVAPYTGAWIEIATATAKIGKTNVAPYTGAWIEIIAKNSAVVCLVCRTLHGCVD